MPSKPHLHNTHCSTLQTKGFDLACAYIVCFLALTGVPTSVLVWAPGHLHCRIPCCRLRGTPHLVKECLVFWFCGRCGGLCHHNINLPEVLLRGSGFNQRNSKPLCSFRPPGRSRMFQNKSLVSDYKGHRRWPHSC